MERDGVVLDPYTRLGTVVDNVDPLGMRRVRVSIENITSRSAPALPKTGGGGGAQRGGHSVPKIGQQVFITFLDGDRDRPVYEGAHWANVPGRQEAPSDIVAAGAEGALVASLEISGVRFTVDERPGRRAFRLSCFVDNAGVEQLVGSLEFDVEKRVLDVFALAGIQFRTAGFFDVRNALVARILKRRVRRTNAPI
jgi:hypothetical protein